MLVKRAVVVVACKAGGGGCCKHVAALLYNILDYTELGLNEIPPDKTCTELPQQWHKPKNITYNGPALFSEIQFVHHVCSSDEKIEKISGMSL